MTRRSTLITVILLVILGGCKTDRSEQEDADLAKTVVILGLDGFSVEGFKTAKHPNLDRLLKDGVLSLNTRAVMPSVTLPNWTSHLTGSGPEQHGVNGNGWTIEDHPLPPMEQDDDGYYPSIFKVLKEEVPNVKTAYYYNWDNLIMPFSSRRTGTGVVTFGTCPLTELLLTLPRLLFSSPMTTMVTRVVKARLIFMIYRSKTWSATMHSIEVLIFRD